MRCSLARTFLPLHVGGDLPGPMRSLVEAHLEGCRACAEELAGLERMRERLRGLEVSRLGFELPADEALSVRTSMESRLGDGFWEEIRRDLRSEGLVRSAVAREPPRRRERALSRGLVGRALLAAAAALLAAILFLPGAKQVSAPPELPVAPARVAGLFPTQVPRERPHESLPVVLIDRGGEGAPEASPPPGLLVVPQRLRAWVEETRSFSPPDVEFGLERWRLDEDPAPEANRARGAKESGTLSF